jgi:hypothetical protein
MMRILAEPCDGFTYPPGVFAAGIPVWNRLRRAAQPPPAPQLPYSRAFVGPAASGRCLAARTQRASPARSSRRGPSSG